MYGDRRALCGVEECLTQQKSPIPYDACGPLIRLAATCMMMMIADSTFLLVTQRRHTFNEPDLHSNNYRFE
jgi:hypothetical protein